MLNGRSRFQTHAFIQGKKERLLYVRWQTLGNIQINTVYFQEMYDQGKEREKYMIRL